ncbi:MAG: hypothetical protein HQL22_03625 [Candidatus Omnitrophica bacterium]|nr:hypothetical protein [Candidatus Omnitrophota bacterium]
MGLSFAQGLPGGLPLPAPAVAWNTSALQGVKTFINEPFRFEFLMDRGAGTKETARLEADRLVKYFLTALALPEKDLWVNLSPNEPDRILTPAFARTLMGRDLLAQDLVLKKLTGSLMAPDNETGRKFWDKVYARLKERFGLAAADIPIDTINKVWIVPGKAVVYEKNSEAAGPHGVSALILEAHLKVMAEADHAATSPTSQPMNMKATEGINLSPNTTLARDVLREVVIPALEDEVNNGKDFAPLRQAYHSLILAAWYKRKIRESLVARSYVDTRKTQGVERPNNVGEVSPQKIYQDYLAAYRDGLKGTVIEEADHDTGELIPRKYATGGILGDMSQLIVSTDAAAAQEKVLSFSALQRIGVCARPSLPAVRPFAADLPGQLNELERMLSGRKQVNGFFWPQSNEEGVGEILQQLDRRPGKGSGIHLGTSSLLNLSIAAARRSQAVVIVDINRNVTSFWRMVRAVILSPEMADVSRPLAERRRAFMLKLVRAVLNDRLLAPYLADDTLLDRDKIERMADEPDSWLSSDDSFAFVQRLFKEGKVVNLTMDLLETEGVHGIQGWMRRYNLRADTMYLSNIMDVVSGRVEYPAYPVGDGSKVAVLNDHIRLLTDGLTALIESREESEGLVLSVRDASQRLNMDRPQSIERDKAEMALGWIKDINARLLRHGGAPVVSLAPLTFLEVKRAVKTAFAPRLAVKVLSVMVSMKCFVKVDGEWMLRTDYPDLSARLQEAFPRKAVVPMLMKRLCVIKGLGGILSAHSFGDGLLMVQSGRMLVARGSDEGRMKGFDLMTQGVQILERKFDANLPVLQEIMGIERPDQFDGLLKKYKGTYQSPVPSQNLLQFLLVHHFGAHGKKGMRGFADFKADIRELIAGWPAAAYGIRTLIAQTEAARRVPVPAAEKGGIDFDTSKVDLEVHPAAAQAFQLTGLLPVIVSIRPAGALTDFAAGVK